MIVSPFGEFVNRRRVWYAIVKQLTTFRTALHRALRPERTPMEQLSIAEKADILHQTAQLYLSSSLPTDYGTGQLYTATEVHALKYIIEHDGKTAAELSLDWDISRAAVSQLMKKLEAKGLVQRRPYPGSRRKMLYLPTEAGLALNRCHTQYDTQVFGETLALLEARCPQADIECCFRVLEQYIQARRQKHYSSTPE